MANHTTNERWAILDKDNNAILIMVNQNIPTNDTWELGLKQAEADMSGNLGLGSSVVPKDEIRIQDLGGRKWYTYGLRYDEQKMNAAISGTICNSNEIRIILITEEESYVNNIRQYLKILKSFRCE